MTFLLHRTISPDLLPDEPGITPQDHFFLRDFCVCSCPSIPKLLHTYFRLRYMFRRCWPDTQRVKLKHPILANENNWLFQSFAWQLPLESFPSGLPSDLPVSRSPTRAAYPSPLSSAQGFPCHPPRRGSCPGTRFPPAWPALNWSQPQPSYRPFLPACTMP